MALRRASGSHPDAAHVMVRWIALGGAKHLLPVCPCLLRDESVATLAVSLLDTTGDEDPEWFKVMVRLDRLWA